MRLKTLVTLISLSTVLVACNSGNTNTQNPQWRVVQTFNSNSDTKVNQISMSVNDNQVVYMGSIESSADIPSAISVYSSINNANLNKIFALNSVNQNACKNPNSTFSNITANSTNNTLFITYNCDYESDDELLTDLNQIVCSTTNGSIKSCSVPKLITTSLLSNYRTIINDNSLLTTYTNVDNNGIEHITGIKTDGLAVYKPLFSNILPIGTILYDISINGNYLYVDITSDQSDYSTSIYQYNMTSWESGIFNSFRNSGANVMAPDNTPIMVWNNNDLSYIGLQGRSGAGITDDYVYTSSFYSPSIGDFILGYNYINNMLYMQQSVNATLFNNKVVSVATLDGQLEPRQSYLQKVPQIFTFLNKAQDFHSTDVDFINPLVPNLPKDGSSYSCINNQLSTSGDNLYFSCIYNYNNTNGILIEYYN